MTGPSDSSVQPLAKFCTCHETHPMECEGCRINRERVEARRAALPVASDEPHPPSRHCMCAACRPSFDDDAPLPVAALSDADREKFDQRIMALAVTKAMDEFDDGSTLCFTFRFPGLREFARALLRHSEGKE